jgi:hypothetical protein
MPATSGDGAAEAPPAEGRIENIDISLVAASGCLAGVGELSDLRRPEWEKRSRKRRN